MQNRGAAIDGAHQQGQISKWPARITSSARSCMRSSIDSGKNVIRAVRLANAKAKAARFQELVIEKPKLAHKIMQGKMKDKVEATVLRQADSGTILFKSADVLNETHQFYERLNRAPGQEVTSSRLLMMLSSPGNTKMLWIPSTLKLMLAKMNIGSWTWTGTS